MVKNILDKSLSRQTQIQEQGENKVSEKFFRGVRSHIRKTINDSAFKPWRLNLDGLNGRIAEAMAVAFLVSSGQISPPSNNHINEHQNYSQPFLDNIGFRFDLPFSKALELWQKSNPFNLHLVNRVLDKGKTYSDNFTSRLTLQIQENISEALETGRDVPEIVGRLRAIGDKGSAVYENTLRNGISTAQNAGMKLRLESSSNIAIWEFRVIKDDRTTGAPNGIYATKYTKGRNPGYCWFLHGFKAIPSHPIWKKIYPQNHDGCRAGVGGITWAMAQIKGYLNKDGTVKDKFVNPKIPEFITQGLYPQQGFDVSPDVMLGVA